MFKPRLKMLTAKKVRRNKQPHKRKFVFPRLIGIGNSVGIVISKPLLESIGWKKGDAIEYAYHDDRKILVVRNLSAEQREYDAIHKKN